MKKFLPFTLLLLLFILPSCATRQRDGGYVRLFGHAYGAEVPPVVSIQNEYLRLDFLTATAEIVLTELATGNVFRSTPEGAAESTESAAIEQFFMQSLFILEFENRHGSTRPHDTYRYSVRTGRFEHAVVGDALEIFFTVGDIPQTFHVPYAIYEERLHYFLDQMPRFDQMQILNAFRPFNLERLRTGDNRDELVEMFPTLEYGYTIYVLQDDIAPFILARVEESLVSVGYTMVEWEEDMQYFGVATTINLPAFNVTMRFELDRNNMVVTIPLSEITYVTDFMPTRIAIMPYFGAGRATDEGYLFVPDGSGALLYFDSGRYNQNLYFNNIFGHDEAIMREALFHEQRAPYPVFGISRNGATFAGIIESGAAYAFIRAEVAGMNSPYSRVHPLFRLLHGEALDVAGRSNDSMIMHEWELPQDEKIVIRYVITETPGYVGMAHAYRAFLQERYPWLNNRVEAPVHAMVEILGAALTPQHILGFPVDRPFPLTTYDGAARMMETLHGFGWENLHIKMRGAHNDSIDHIVPTSLDLIRQLGNRRAFNNMVGTANDLGFTFYLEGDFVFMRGTRLFDGFTPMRDAARHANRERVEHAGFSPVYFGALGTGSIMADPIILARPEFTISTIENFVREAAGAGVNNIAFRSLASALSGDFNEDRHVSREASMNMRVDLLHGLMNDGTGIWLNYGFSYAMPFADVITGMPMTDQNFGITCIAVPFYQIALHGLIPFAGRPLNLAEDHSYHLLKSIEAGASLFFSFMDVPTADLQVTRYRRYFANEFGRWAHVANDLYQRHVMNFGHLYNQLIVDHQVLSRDGVSLTVYEDGTRVYVNTTLADFTTESGVLIPARGNGTPYVVIRG